MVLNPRWALQDTTTPTILTPGVIPDGDFLQRSGTTIIGASIPSTFVHRLSETTGIDAKTTGTTNLYTVPASTTTIVLGAVVRVTAASGITVAATAGIGIAAGEDDIFASEALTDLLAVGDVWVFSSQGIIVDGNATEVIKFGIDTAATGTSQTLAVDLIGYEF